MFQNLLLLYPSIKLKTKYTIKSKIRQKATSPPENCLHSYYSRCVECNYNKCTQDMFNAIFHPKCAKHNFQHEPIIALLQHMLF